MDEAVALIDAGAIVISIAITYAIGVHFSRGMSSVPQLERQNSFTAAMQMFARVINIQLSAIKGTLSI